MMKVTVVVPIYNVEKYLERCIKSIIGQTLKEIEIILINDGSTDNSKDICERYKEQDTRIKVMHTENKGSGEARNLGIYTAVGEYVYFCDPDDWIEPNTLEENYNMAKENDSDVVFFGINNYTYDEVINTPIYVGDRTTSNVTQEFRREFIKLYNKGLAKCVWNKLYKLDYIKRNDYRFSSYSQGQDWSFNLLVYRNLNRYSYNNNKYYNYVKYNNNTAITRYNKDKTYIRIQLFNEFKNLLEYWKGNEEGYEELLYQSFVEDVLADIRNTFHLDCKDSLIDKIRKCKAIIESEETQIALSKVEHYKTMKSTSDKVTLFMIKHKCIMLMLIENTIRQIVKPRLKPLIYKLKYIKREKKIEK